MKPFHNKRALSPAKKASACALGLALLCLGACATARVPTVESGPRKAGHRVLVATESSEFKQNVASLVAHDLEKDGGFIRVMDLSGLRQETAANWSAVVLIGACRFFSLDPRVACFVKNEPQRQKLILYTMARNQGFEAGLFGVDAITGASDLSDAASVARLLAGKVRALLK